ncbi:MAG: preprotein translocase subunit SecG [Sphingobacterium sp.]
MEILFIILIVLASLLLSFFVLIQNPKGGGLSSGFSGGANLIGVQRTGDILEKGTWILIISVMVFSIAINILGTSSTAGGLGDQIEAPVQAPTMNLNPTQAPANTAPQETLPVTADSTK